MANFGSYRVGVGSVGQYMMSGIPYVSSSISVAGSAGSPEEINFPRITKFITVVNEATGSAAPIRVGFSSNGVSDSGDNNYFVLANGESYTGEFRVTSIYLLGDSATSSTCSVIAGLTGITTASLGTDWHNWSGSAGVG